MRIFNQVTDDTIQGKIEKTQNLTQKLRHCIEKSMRKSAQIKWATQNYGHFSNRCVSNA